MCAPGDARALAEAIEALLLDPTRACELGAAGRHAVAERFSAEAMAQATLTLYRELAGKGVVSGGVMPR